MSQKPLHTEADPDQVDVQSEAHEENKNRQAKYEFERFLHN